MTCKLIYLLALPFVANFTAGAIAGISEILTFYPLGRVLIHAIDPLNDQICTDVVR